MSLERIKDIHRKMMEDELAKILKNQKMRDENTKNGKKKIDLNEFISSLDDYPDLEGIESIVEELGEVEELEDYKTNSHTESISFLEFAIINQYMHSSYRKSISPVKVINYGHTDNMGKIYYGGSFEATQGWWFQTVFENDENEYIFDTKIYMDSSKTLVTELHITSKTSVTFTVLFDKLKDLKKIAFNNSEYCGKCIKIKLKEGRFRAIEIIEMPKSQSKLILTPIQKKYINHFINSVGKGRSVRYLFNGEPGTGKTDSIREIAKELTPNVTFVIPDFATTEDLTTILEACEIFEKGVIIMDDIDLYLGSRDNGSYTKLLGEFLSFFDGVKKRKISLLASTNDKGLVDKAAERPGRFNMTLDYTFLTDEQIIEVCEVHLPIEYQVEEVYNVLKGALGGRKAKITGAFIANLSENIREMSDGNSDWNLAETIDLITESYKGFYTSQVDKIKNSTGFNIN